MKHAPTAAPGTRPARGRKAVAAGDTESTAVAAAATPAAEAPQQQPAAEVSPPEPSIEAMAYSFYEARGRIDGHDLDDWLKAEAQIAAGR